MNAGTFVFDFFNLLVSMTEKLSQFFSFKLGDLNLGNGILSSIAENFISASGLGSVTISGILVGGGLLVLIGYSIIK